MICKGCKKEINEDKLLVVFEGAARIPAHFHGKDCWNLYKGCGTIDEKYPQLRSASFRSDDEANPR